MSQQEYALLSDVSYKGTKAQKEKYLRDNNLEYWIDTRNSNPHHTVLRHKLEDRAVVSFRGTKDAGDIGTDVALALGFENLTKRYKDSDRLVSAVKDKYQKEDIVLVGHSLGGNIAHTLGQKHDLNVHAFNPGSSPANVHGKIASKIKSKDRDSKSHFYVVPGDIIAGAIPAISGSGDILHRVEQKSDNPHSLSNFIEIEEEAKSALE